MNRSMLITLASLVVWSSAALAQQDARYDDEGRPREGVPTAGFWPTPLMIERFIDRATEDMAERYEFDEDQLYQAREIFKERLPGWLSDNRGEIQQAVNEFIEAQLNDQAPDIDHVADWSQRVLPLMNDFQGLVGEMTGEMRDFMTEDQQDKLDGEIAAFDTGLQFTRTKLQRWGEGGYDPETEWHRKPEERRRVDREERRRLETEMEAARQEALARAERDRAAAQQATADATGQPAAQTPERPTAQPRDVKKPEDAWVAYVEHFKQRYDLNPDQRSKADSILQAQIEQRDHYLRRSADKMEKITKLFQDPDRYENAQELYKKLNVPVERMFTTLKQKLDKLPTRAQRKAAGKVDLERQDESTKRSE